MLEDDILEALSEEKGFDALQSELDVPRKKLKTALKSLTDSGKVETDGDVYWKADEKTSSASKKGGKTSSNAKYAPLIVLAGIVLLGFFLRSYHMDYPVIGYHNWKEEHYLGEARNFARDGFFKYGIFVPAWDYPFLNSDPSGAHSDTFPTISIIVGLVFMVVGPQLWAARLVNIVFNLGAVAFTYFFMKKLFKREDIALLTTLLAATLPLFVFFSHNTDLINPGLFFMMASAYFYLLWRESWKARDMVLTAAFLALAGLTKYPFLVIAAPMFFTLPFKDFIAKKGRWKEEASSALKTNWKPLLISVLILSTIPLWIVYSEGIIGQKYGTMAYTLSEGKMVQLEVLSDPVWWQTLKSYVRDNYTMTGLGMAGLGIVALLIMLVLHYTNKVEFGLGDQFLLFYFLIAIPFITVMSYKLGGHSYHQYPIAPLVIMLIAYFMIRVGDGVKKLLPAKDMQPFAGFVVAAFFLSFFVVPWLGLIFPASSPMCADYGFCESFSEVTNRQWDTQYWGTDIAGEYIKKNSNHNERILFPSFQSYGVLWSADRKGYKEMFSVDTIKQAESQGATWAFLYQWGLSTVVSNQTVWNYYKDNYSLKEAAYIQTEQGPQPLYLLLKKGGSFTENQFLSPSGTPKQKAYELTGGRKMTVLYIDFDA